MARAVELFVKDGHRHPLSIYHPSLQDAVSSFLRSCEAKNLSPQTIQFYSKKLKVALAGINSLEELTPHYVRDFLATQLKTKSETTVRHYYISLQTLCNYLLMDGLIESSPLSKIPKPKRREVPIEPLSPGEVEQILMSCDSHDFCGIRNRAAIIILYDCGLRIGELCRLELQDIDWNDATLLIRKSKTGKFRSVPFGNAAKREFLRYIAARGKQETDTLFITEYGLPTEPERWSHIFAKLSKDTGITRLHAHLFRHSCAVNMLRNGADAFTVQRQLGHSNIQTTQIYVQLSNTDLIKAHTRTSPADHLSPKALETHRKKLR